MQTECVMKLRKEYTDPQGLERIANFCTLRNFHIGRIFSFQNCKWQYTSLSKVLNSIIVFLLVHLEYATWKGFKKMYKVMYNK